MIDVLDALGALGALGALDALGGLGALGALGALDAVDVNAPGPEHACGHGLGVAALSLARPSVEVQRGAQGAERMRVALRSTRPSIGRVDCNKKHRKGWKRYTHKRAHTHTHNTRTKIHAAPHCE